jgi:hypothetical protein
MEKNKGGKRRNQGQFESCALAVASGSSIGAWARSNKVPERTAYGWSMTAEFKLLVTANRNRIIDRTIGILTRHATLAANELARLIKSGDSDHVKLAAARAMLDQRIAVATHAEATHAIAELQARIDDLERGTERDAKKTGPTG